MGAFMRAHTGMRVHRCVQAHMHICTCVYTCANTGATHVHMCTQCLLTCMYTHLLTCMYAHTSLLTYTCVHTHADTSTRPCAHRYGRPQVVGRLHEGLEEVEPWPWGNSQLPSVGGTQTPAESRTDLLTLVSGIPRGDCRDLPAT